MDDSHIPRSQADLTGKRGRPAAPLTRQSIMAPFVRWNTINVRQWPAGQLKHALASVPDISLSAKIRWLILTGFDDKQIFNATGQRLAKIASMRRSLATLLI